MKRARGAIPDTPQVNRSAIAHVMSELACNAVGVVAGDAVKRVLLLLALDPAVGDTFEKFTSWDTLVGKSERRGSA